MGQCATRSWFREAKSLCSSTSNRGRKDTGWPEKLIIESKEGETEDYSMDDFRGCFWGFSALDTNSIQLAVEEVIEERGEYVRDQNGCDRPSDGVVLGS